MSIGHDRRTSGIVEEIRQMGRIANAVEGILRQHPTFRSLCKPFMFYHSSNVGEDNRIVRSYLAGFGNSSAKRSPLVNSRIDVESPEGNEE